jgi:hypothetical protein
MTGKAVLKYNYEKPHGSLSNVSPYHFELSLGVININGKRKKEAKKEKTQECG